MKNTDLWGLLLTGAGLVSAESVLAHHSFVQFDQSTELIMSGEVVRWAFNAPHS